MIIRTYFMSVKKPHDDGNGSYSFMWSLSTKCCLFPNHSGVFEDMLSEMESRMSDIPGGALDVVAFNRV